MTTDHLPAVSRREAFGIWLRVALQSFGGPAGQIAVIHRLVVDEKRWLSEERFMHALSYCMLLPGPEAQQLATYIGWLMGGVRGGLVAGMLFIAPGFISILVLSVLYAGYHDIGVVEGVFYGLKPAVIAVVLEALMRLKRRGLRERFEVALAGTAFVALFFFAVPFPLVVAGAALAAAVGGRLGVFSAGFSSHAHAELVPPAVVVRPSLVGAAGKTAGWIALWLVPLAIIAAIAGRDHIFVREGVFFSKAAVVTFGGAYSVLTYVAQQAVETHHWLTAGQMLDGLGLAETTPGPLIQVVQFVGFMGAYASPGNLHPMVSGIIGSIVTTWVTFVPCFMFIFVGAPFVEYLRQHRLLTTALRGISAAVVGVVLNLTLWFATHTLFAEVQTNQWGPVRVLTPQLRSADLAAVSITVLAMLALFRWKIGMLPTLAGAALVGVMLRAVFS